jgi:hypothetical protein
MEVRGLLHTLAALPPEKSPPYTQGIETGSALELVWILRAVFSCLRIKSRGRLSAINLRVT